MEVKNEKNLISPKDEKILPAPDEKLLRAPTFLEKHSLLRISIAAVILIAIVTAGVMFAPSRFVNREENKNINILVTPVQEDAVSYEQDISLMSYKSAEGMYSIDYPNNYNLDIKNDGKGTIQLSTEDRSGSYFRLLIEPVKLQGKFTLDQVIKNNPVCGQGSTQNAIGSMINNSIPAKIYTNLDCLAQGKTLIRAVTDVDGGTMMYTFIIDSPFTLDEFKGQLDELISTFKVNNNPVVEDTDSFVPPNEEAVFCTMDAMQCPDGTWVGRSGPKCEFVCSGGSASAPDKPVDLNSGM